jgi:hypothetical protein
MRITGTINGYDDASKDWTGDLDLHVNGHTVNGTIKWTRRNYDGTESVEGTIDDGTLKFKGVGDVKNRGRYKVVNSSYSGSLENNDRIRLHWIGPGRVPDGEASGKVTIRK